MIDNQYQLSTESTESERYLQTSDFRLRTSRLQISESLFPDFLRHWFLHFHTKQKIPLAFRRIPKACATMWVLLAFPNNIYT